MNRKDGRSIDWRWGSLIPLSADDGVYGDHNKSVKKARDDVKGKFADIFSCSGRLEASLIFLSFLSPIVFFVVSYPYFACTFTSRLAHKVRISALLVSLRSAYILPSSVEIVAA